MKILYRTETREILAKYSGGPSSFPGGEITPTAGEGQTLVDVPEGVFGQAVSGINEDGSFMVDQDIVNSQWSQVRAQRNQLLKDSDWTCSVTDYEVPNKSEWIAYRAALRNVTEQADPFAITWPVKNS